MLNWKVVFLFFLLPLWISFPLHADVSFSHYGVEKGLPEVRISSITQDSAGFIWMAGENNLYRFDGDRFKTYRNTRHNSADSYFGKINMLFTDSKGSVWVGSSNGVAYYDFPGDNFIHLNEGWAMEDVFDITEDKKGNIWLATNSGLAKFDTESMQTFWYTDSIKIKTEGKVVLPVSQITELTCQDDGRIWFADENDALYLFDPVTLKTKEISIIKKTEENIKIISKLHYQNDLLFISTINNGFFWFNPEKNELQGEDFFPLGNTIHHFTVGNDSIVWIAGNNGLFEFNIKKRTFNRYTEEPGNPVSMKRTAITFVYQDREKNLWISSGLRGVDYGLTNSPFDHFTQGDDGAYQIARPEITAIAFDQENNMWLGYEEGIIEKHSHTPLKKTSFNGAMVNETGNPGAIFSLFCDSQNRIWCGGWKTGLLRLNQWGTVFQKVPIFPQALAPVMNEADIRDIAEDSNGNLWLSIHGAGLGKYNPENHSLELYQHNPLDTEGSLSNNWTYNMCIDKSNNLWIASAHGLSKYNLQTGTFENYHHDPNNPKSLNNNSVNTVYCDPAGMIWAGTDNGLNVYIPALKTFIPVLSVQENDSYSISDIQSTKPGEIWASTKSGIIHLSWSLDSAQEGLLVNSRFFNRRSGLLSTSYFARSSASTSDGYLFFGGNEGIDFFYADQASAFQTLEPVPVITELTIDGLPVRFENNNLEGKTLQLDYGHRMLSVRFTAPAYNNPERIKYRYMLEGFGEQWIYPQYEQVAIFTNLPPGHYQFRVETEDRNGVWSQKAAVLPVHVNSPFWRTLWFYLLVIAFTTLLIVLFIYSRSRLYLLRQKELQKIIDSRTKELLYNNAELEKINHTKDKMFSIISHDLRSPFAGVLGILELLADRESGIEGERKNELLLMAKNSAENTFELLENLLTWAHSQMKKTVSKPVKQNLSRLLIKNMELKKTAAQQKEIEMVQNFADDLEAKFDKDMINTVVRNLLNNAVKFTHPGGKIEVSAFVENGYVRINIADTGVGIDPGDADSLFYDGNISRKGTLGEKGTGLGLIISREFIEKNAGTIWATPNQPRGTVFSFTLPEN